MKEVSPIQIEEGETPKVKNRSTCDWDILVLCREKDEWLARNVKAGDYATLQSITLDSAVVELQKRTGCFRSEVS